MRQESLWNSKSKSPAPFFKGGNSKAFRVRQHRRLFVPSLPVSPVLEKDEQQVALRRTVAPSCLPLEKGDKGDFLRFCCRGERQQKCLPRQQPSAPLVSPLKKGDRGDCLRFPVASARSHAFARGHRHRAVAVPERRRDALHDLVSNCAADVPEPSLADSNAQTRWICAARARPDARRSQRP